MAKKTKRIANANLPIRSPIHLALVFWLLLDRFQISPAWWGVYWTVVVLLVSGWIFGLCATDAVDIFDDEKGR